MKHKKSVLKILSANSECFRVSAGIAPNIEIGARKLRVIGSLNRSIEKINLPNVYTMCVFVPAIKQITI